MKVRGEGRGEHQRNPKDKVGELSVSQPSHTVSSQKGTAAEKEISSLLVTSSQKDVTIEKSSQPGTQNKRGRDTTSPKSISQKYERRVKPKTGDAQGSHTAQTTDLFVKSVPS